jgi:hypothetical protein
MLNLRVRIDNTFTLLWALLIAFIISVKILLCISMYLQTVFVAETHLAEGPTFESTNSLIILYINGIKMEEKLNLF